MHKWCIVSIFWVCCIAFVYAQTSKEELLRKKVFNLGKDGVALEGYDVTTYFTGKPQKGSKAFFYSYKGVRYLFSSAQNAALFKANPAGYEPAYGGWCAYAMGTKGEKVEVDRENYKIEEGKLLLFYKGYFSNTLDDWNKDPLHLHQKADVNWAGFLK